MSDLCIPVSGLIFGSALYNCTDLNLESVKALWCERFGPSLEFHHAFFPMKDYYSLQMGESSLLRRVILVSLRPIARERLVEHKIWSDEAEKELAKKYGHRALNLDIGLLTPENVTLATGKNYAHRIYLGRGVFSDLTLQFEHKTFKPLTWTYPDYAHPDFVHFFNWVRGFLVRKNMKILLD